LLPDRPLDGAHPVLAHICQTGSLKRQAIFAVLSELARDSPETLADRMRAVIPQPVTYTDDPLAVIARALVVARPSALLKSLFGSVPNGLLGVMRRLGDNPFRDPQSYRALHELMAYPAHRQRAKVLLQIGGPLNETTVQIVREIDPIWARVEVVQRLPTMERMHEFQQAVKLIQSLCPEVSCEDLSRSFERLEARASVSTWAQRWIRKATRFPPGPTLADDAAFRPLLTGADIHEAAKRFKNCLASKLPEIVLGRLFYIEFRPAPALIELVRLNRGEWALEGLYGPTNAPLSNKTIEAIVSKLDVGVHIPVRFTETEMGSVALLLGLPELDRHWANVLMR
jgi:hypothetical protein